jgi:hypothetical protein
LISNGRTSRLTHFSLNDKAVPGYWHLADFSQRTAMYNRFQFNQFRSLFAPRKPRHPLVRVAVGLLGLAILAALVFVGVFVGAAMIIAGVAWKLLANRKQAARAADPQVVEGEYRVVRKQALPLSR